MNFFQRLKRYLFGVLLGIALSIFFFQDRTSLLTSWLPANRVKTMIIEIPWQNDSTQMCLLRCIKTNEADLKTAIDAGDVLFDESQVKSEPKTYVVKTDLGKSNFIIKDSLVVFDKHVGCDC
jgi:hypothetical protein